MNIDPLKGGDYGELVERWSRWKVCLECFSITPKQETKSKAHEMATLKQCIGDEGLRSLKMLSLTED